MSNEERAEQLARELERLLAGENIPGGDPLLNVARQLQGMPLQPSPAAQLRFEQQLTQWFGTPTPTPQPRPTIPRPVVISVVVVAVVVILAIVIITIAPKNQIAPTLAPTASPVPSATVTATMTMTPTGIPSATATPPPTVTSTVLPSGTAAPTTITATADPGVTISPTAPGSPTAVNFIKIIVSGPIDTITDQQIVILGQPIIVEGSITGLCTGDVVMLEAILIDGKFHINRVDIKITSSGCGQSIQFGGGNPAPSGGNNPGGKGKPDHHHDDD